MENFSVGNVKDFIEIAFWWFWGFIAWQGLTTWKKQIKGTVELETARKILNQVYKLRREIEIIRNAYFPAYEMIYKWDKEWMSKEDLAIAWLKEAYNKRFELLDKTKQDILIDILEAEVLWWKEIKVKLYNYLYVISELEVAVQEFFEIKTISNLEKQELCWKERNKEIKEIIWAKSLNSIEINPKDKYALRLEEKIKDIENYLKKYLKM